MSNRNVLKALEESKELIEPRYELGGLEGMEIIEKNDRDPFKVVSDAYRYGFVLGVRQERKRKAPECRQELSSK